jgi:hypothetical protein
MLLILLLLLVAVLVFGGLGLFVAKAFFLALAVVLVVGLVSGSTMFRRH